mmetsp:Transcript_27214/g.55536  ORF Transcript_27214/g.55536 Transcript_27214/m.55536 type:complete len:136 (-) Transcript_27214:130-537(-)
MMLKLFFLVGAILPLPGISLYVFEPGGTVEFFNGQQNSTTNFWCTLAASGDAVVSFLCFSALMTSSSEVNVLVVRALAVYSVFHFGSFYYWHHHGDKHPDFMVGGYPASIAISFAALLWWGILYPPPEKQPARKD